MRFDKHIVLCLVTLLLIGCGVKKKAVEPVVPPTPTWHTCLIQGSRATVIRDGESMASNVLMQTVHDSMIVISVTPLFGMEIMRIEATPTELIGIDKIHGQYATATFADLNRKLTPNLNWDILQQVCTAELPTGSQRARLQYLFGDETIELIIEYGERKTDVPVRVAHQPLSRYTQIDVSKFL